MPHEIILTAAQRERIALLTPRNEPVLLLRLYAHGGLVVSLNEVAFAMDTAGNIAGLTLEEEQLVFSRRREAGLPDEVPIREHTRAVA